MQNSVVTVPNVGVGKTNTGTNAEQSQKNAVKTVNLALQVV